MHSMDYTQFSIDYAARAVLYTCSFTWLVHWSVCRRQRVHGSGTLLNVHVAQWDSQNLVHIQQSSSSISCWHCPYVTSPVQLSHEKHTRLGKPCHFGAYVRSGPTEHGVAIVTPSRHISATTFPWRMQRRYWRRTVRWVILLSSSACYLSSVTNLCCRGHTRRRLHCTRRVVVMDTTVHQLYTPVEQRAMGPWDWSKARTKLSILLQHYSRSKYQRHNFPPTEWRMILSTGKKFGPAHAKCWLWSQVASVVVLARVTNTWHRHANCWHWYCC